MQQRPGDALLNLVAQAGELLLVAPYIKIGALERILDVHADRGALTVVTRWRLDELAAGVSDIGVYPLIRERRGALALHPALHAKYYASGDQALIGSANITAAALGWREDANLEILVQSPREGLRYFEQELNAGRIDVDDRLYESFRVALAEFPPIVFAGGSEGAMQLFCCWRPTLRHPEDLYQAYIGRSEELSTSSHQAAETDLIALSPPRGMSRAQFDLWIGAQLRQHPELSAIDAFLETPRRFGEMRAFLVRRGVVDGDRAWQQWMRWMLYFLGGDYAMKVANYSEIFSRREVRQKTGEERAIT